MNIDIHYENGYMILEITDDIDAYTKLDELVPIVKNALQQNNKKIALSITEKSFLYSALIKVIMYCYDLIKEQRGDFVFIQANKDISAVFKALGVDKIIKVFPSREAFLHKKI